MLKSLLAELKGRHAVRVASVYVTVAWATLRGIENFLRAPTLPAWTVCFRSLWDFDRFQRLDRLRWFAGLRDDARFRAFVAAIDADNRAMAARCDICGP